MVRVWLRSGKMEYPEANWAGIHPTGKSVEVGIMNHSGIGFTRIKPIAHFNMDYIERVECPDAPEITIAMGGPGAGR